MLIPPEYIELVRSAPWVYRGRRAYREGLARPELVPAALHVARGNAYAAARLLGVSSSWVAGQAMGAGVTLGGPGVRGHALLPACYIEPFVTRWDEVLARWRLGSECPQPPSPPTDAAPGPSARILPPENLPLRET